MPRLQTSSITEDDKTFSVKMKDLGTYPSQTQASIVANQYMVTLPKGLGHIRYFVEAVDTKGNTAYSPVGRVFIQ